MGARPSEREAPSFANDQARRNLRRVLTERGMDASVLGERVFHELPPELAHKRMRRHLSGETRITLDDIALYARVLQMNSGELAFGERK